MNTLQGALAAVVALFAFVAILGVAFVYFRGSADKATLEAQGRLIATRDVEIADLTHRVEVLETENQTLRRAVAQVAGIDVLQTTANEIQTDVRAIRSRLGNDTG